MTNGYAPTSQQVDALLEAVEEMGAMLRDSWGALGHFTCNEFEKIADVFRATGDEHTVHVITSLHASGDDDEDDLHHDIYVNGDDIVAGAGPIEVLPALEAAAERTKIVRTFTSHNQDNGDWCPWSGVELSGEPRDHDMCPARCAASSITENEESAEHGW